MMGVDGNRESQAERTSASVEFKHFIEHGIEMGLEKVLSSAGIEKIPIGSHTITMLLDMKLNKS